MPPDDDRARRARFTELWLAHHDDVLAYGLRRTPGQAADLTAEVFAIAWRRLDDVPPDAPLPWLYGVARRVLLNARRGERRSTALVRRLAQAAAPPRAFEDGTLDDGLRRAVAELPRAQREALLLTAWGGLEARQGALVAGCSPGAFRVRVHRARRRVARAMGDRRALALPLVAALAAAAVLVVGAGRADGMLGPIRDALGLDAQYVRLGLSEEAHSARREGARRSAAAQACIDRRGVVGCADAIAANETYLDSPAFRGFLAELGPRTEAGWQCAYRRAGLDNAAPGFADLAQREPYRSRLQAATQSCWDDLGLPQVGRG